MPEVTVLRRRRAERTGLRAAVRRPARPLGAQGANLAALLVTAVANTAANRALTFGVRGRAGALNAQVAGLVALALALALTSTSLLALHAAPSRGVELWLLLAATAVLYLRALSASGWANSFCTAAVQAGTQSWKASFFGVLDAGGSITVDEPPAALWVMGLSARLFGLSSWSLLVPQALEGVAAVAVLAAAVRRTSGSVAALVAGAVLALGLVATRRAPRTDPVRAAPVL